MIHRGHIYITHEIEHPDTGGIISSTDLRIHYAFLPGCPARLWGDCPHPDEPAEIELYNVERDVAGTWVTVVPDDGLWLWAESYLEKHPDEVCQDVADMRAEAAEYRAEMRSDRL